MVIRFYRPILSTILTTIKTALLLPGLVKQRFDRYNKITLIDNIKLLTTSYREDDSIVILRVTEEEIEYMEKENTFLLLKLSYQRNKEKWLMTDHQYHNYYL